MNDQRKRARVTSTIRDEQKKITGPPREVFYIDTRQGEIEPAEEPEDDEPILRRPQRSSMPTMIIYAFIGAVSGMVIPAIFIIGRFLAVGADQRSSIDPKSQFGIAIMACICWGIPTFVMGGCVGAFVWALTRRMR